MSSSILSQVEDIAAGAPHVIEQAMPMVAAIAAEAHGAASDHETRLQKLEDLVAQWAPLIAATAAVVDKAVAAPTPDKPGA